MIRALVSGSGSDFDVTFAKTNWTDKQTEVLVNLWRENAWHLRSTRNLKIWQDITVKLNRQGHGSYKTCKQCKDKIKNLKDSYKRAKSVNSKPGAVQEYPPYYDIFDVVLTKFPVRKKADMGKKVARESDTVSEEEIDDDLNDDLNDNADEADKIAEVSPLPQSKLEDAETETKYSETLKQALSSTTTGTSGQVTGETVNSGTMPAMVEISRFDYRTVDDAINSYEDQSLQGRRRKSVPRKTQSTASSPGVFTGSSVGSVSTTIPHSIGSSKPTGSQGTIDGPAKSPRLTESPTAARSFGSNTAIRSIETAWPNPPTVTVTSRHSFQYTTPMVSPHPKENMTKDGSQFSAIPVPAYAEIERHVNYDQFQHQPSYPTLVYTSSRPSQVATQLPYPREPEMVPESVQLLREVRDELRSLKESFQRVESHLVNRLTRIEERRQESESHSKERQEDFLLKLVKILAKGTDGEK